MHYLACALHWHVCRAVPTECFEANSASFNSDFPQRMRISVILLILGSLATTYKRHAVHCLFFRVCCVHSLNYIQYLIFSPSTRCISGMRTSCSTVRESPKKKSSAVKAWFCYYQNSCNPGISDGLPLSIVRPNDQSCASICSAWSSYYGYVPSSYRRLRNIYSA